MVTNMSETDPSDLENYGFPDAFTPPPDLLENDHVGHAWMLEANKIYSSLSAEWEQRGAATIISQCFEIQSRGSIHVHSVLSFPH